MKEIPVKKSFLGDDSSLAKGERNDCVVRALTAATGLEYETIHSFTRDHFGRERNKGVFGTVYKMKKITDVLGKPFTIFEAGALQTTYMNYGKEVKRRMTVGTFVQRYPTGTYMLLVRGHAFTIIDGVVVGGNTEDGVMLKRRLQAAYKF